MTAGPHKTLRGDGPVKVIHGANDGLFNIAGTTVATLRESLSDAFNIPVEALAFANGEQVDSRYRLLANDTVEFVKQYGEKSVLDPEEKAQLDRIEAMLTRLFSSLHAEDRLTDREQDILDALGDEKMTGEELAKASGYEYDGHFKSLLSSLVKRGLLLNDHPGYRRRKSGLRQD